MLFRSELSQATLSQFKLKAPVDGIILKVFIKSGEYISDSTQNPLLTMGNDKPLHVRVQIDENDAWRFDAKAKAIAYLRSNKDISMSLSFIRIDPFAISKQQLSGSSKDLVDTRIIEVVYKVEGEPKNVFIGQQLDVFIEAKSYFARFNSLAFSVFIRLSHAAFEFSDNRLVSSIALSK